METNHQWHLWYFIATFSGLLLLQHWLADYSAEAPIPYSEFQRLLGEDKLSDLQVEQNRITGTLKEPVQGRTRFTTNRVEPELAAQLQKSNVAFNGTGENSLGKLLGWLLPFILIFALWSFFSAGSPKSRGWTAW